MKCLLVLVFGLLAASCSEVPPPEAPPPDRSVEISWGGAFNGSVTTLILPNDTYVTTRRSPFDEKPPKVTRGSLPAGTFAKIETKVRATLPSLQKYNDPLKSCDDYGGDTIAVEPPISATPLFNGKSGVIALCPEKAVIALIGEVQDMIEGS